VLFEAAEAQQQFSATLSPVKWLNSQSGVPKTPLSEYDVYPPMQDRPGGSGVAVSMKRRLSVEVRHVRNDISLFGHPDGSNRGRGLRDHPKRAGVIDSFIRELVAKESKSMNGGAKHGISRTAICRKKAQKVMEAHEALMLFNTSATGQMC
jgi:hypothetical protein